MSASNQKTSPTFHMSLVEPVVVLVISLFGIGLAVGLFLRNVGDFIKTILLLVIGVYGLVVAFSITRKLEVAGSELIVHYLVSKRVIARKDIDAYFVDEQGVNRRTRKFVTIHLVNGQRIRFKDIQEGNDALLKALEGFTGFKPASDTGEEPAETGASHTKGE